MTEFPTCGKPWATSGWAGSAEAGQLQALVFGGTAIWPPDSEDGLDDLIAWFQQQRSKFSTSEDNPLNAQFPEDNRVSQIPDNQEIAALKHE